MERMRFSVLFLLCCLLTSKSANALEKKTYIVHTSKSSMPSRFNQPQLWYDSSLNSVSDSAKIIYTYKTIIHGFSARLTEEEAQALETQKGILSVLQGVGKSTGRASLTGSTEICDVIAICK